LSGTLHEETCSYYPVTGRVSGGMNPYGVEWSPSHAVVELPHKFGADSIDIAPFLLLGEINNPNNQNI